MFDGADLSVVYGNMSQQQMGQQPPPVAPMPELTVPKSSQSHAMPPEPPYNPPVAMYAQQPAAVVVPQDTFWDRLGQKKGDIAKLVMLALVVLLAIALDRFVTHYLTSYTAKAFLSETQELLVRLAYPLAIVVILWVVKAM